MFGDQVLHVWLLVRSGFTEEGADMLAKPVPETDGLADIEEFRPGTPGRVHNMSGVEEAGDGWPS